MNNDKKRQTGQFATPRLYWWILLVIIILAAGVRYRLVDVPLERDEGEYAYAGQLILQGIPPYQQLYNMKLPGIYAAYALILAVFGQTHWGIHLGLLFINAATTALVFLLARRVVDPLAGVAAGACFALLSVGQSVQGIFANSEHFVILPAVGGLLLLVRALDNDKKRMFFISGLLLGTGFLVKQHGIAFVVMGGLYLLICQLQKQQKDLKHLTFICLLFATGVIVPYALTCLIFMQAGIFGKFWFWTVKYAMAYTSQVPLSEAWEIFKNRTAHACGSAPLVWMLSGIGLTALAWDRQLRQRASFIGMFAVFSFLAICPGFYFRPHYFVLTLPVSALLAGATVSSFVNFLSKIPSLATKKSSIRYALPVLILIICLTLSVWRQRIFLFHMSPLQASRTTYGYNPFPESLELARFIRASTRQGDRIAVIGSEPQIFFYSGRRSATGYIYMYPLMEHHDFALQMQKEMIREIESARPEYLLFVNISTSWLGQKDSHKLIFEWLEKYRKQHYKMVGLADMLRGSATLYQWGQDVKWPPRSSSWIAVMKRK
ncbi:MAG: hypothetical protein GY795_04115 [Desulfobacterales bacterium]|nr:hypothetical protein [Desulfobacterales bacterium]